MTEARNAIVTRAKVGRLPTQEVTWPISRAAFDQLARRWRKSGVWLSLWNRRGECLSVDSEAARLWTLLWSHGKRFREELTSLAVAACAGDPSQPEQLPPAPAPLNSWGPDLGVIVTPVRHRQRVMGVVLGVMMLTDGSGEGFLRLCTQCELDEQTMKRAAADAGAVPDGLTLTAAELLRLNVEQARELEATREEIAVLTQNLENTYEEQHLIYQISGMMGLPQKPADMIRRVGQELLEVSRVRAMAFVLSEHTGVHAPPGVPDTFAAQAMSNRVVQIGEGAPTRYDLDRLAECLTLTSHNGEGYLLLNDVCERPGFEWTKAWLQHLVALPMWHEKRLLGVALAINCSDEGDFTSVDVQLLRAVADRVAAFLENQRLYDDLADLLMGLLHALVNSIDAKDQYTCGHSERVAFISRTLAHASGLSPVDCERVYLGGLLHDVGKIGVPDAILCKPGRLTKEEFDAMKKHPEVGARILSHVRQVADLIPGVLHHHERVDGRGYPYGLASHAVPLLGRLICLADCFDAMTTDRTYRAALPLPTVVAEIRRCSGTQFDPELAERFLKLDLRRVMKDARECSTGGSGISQLGALNTAMHGSPDPMESDIHQPQSVVQADRLS
ncbi:MAG TPA: HD domain-containing phosphohydrolase [Phycisphaerae bacterium]|nr:HD domain-containing phosphohydrolase [Phycisphaerae bacterium]